MLCHFCFAKQNAPAEENVDTEQVAKYVHTPVLLQETLNLLSPAICGRAAPLMVDSTLGEGGHSNAFLQKFPQLRLVGVDADSVIMARAAVRLARYGGRVRFCNSNFRSFYANYPADFDVPQAILFDLGVSVFHYEVSGRGFSFLNHEVLDMRLNPALQATSALDIVNTLPEGDLADLLYHNADEKYSRRIAHAIVAKRQAAKIEWADDLAKVVYEAVPQKVQHMHCHPATKTFMALRIAVNGELNGLTRTIHNAFNVLDIGGILGVITFHSIEDRLIKHYFRNLCKECVCPPNFAKCVCGGSPCALNLTKKAVKPSDNEVNANQPSRSAQLRAVQKLHNATDYHLLGVD